MNMYDTTSNVTFDSFYFDNGLTSLYSVLYGTGLLVMTFYLLKQVALQENVEDEGVKPRVRREPKENPLDLAILDYLTEKDGSTSQDLYDWASTAFPETPKREFNARLYTLLAKGWLAKNDSANPVWNCT
jgi:hypothetical protein